jgi:hypothetical protein
MWRAMLVEGLPVYHVVAKVEVAGLSLCAFEIGSWVWERLRDAFPFALAACLMPDHPHVVSPLADPTTARIRLNRRLGHLARRVGVRFVGQAAEPTLVRDRPKLLRELRYVALNPPRAKLTNDPLAWLFSTQRDVVGATLDPWVDASRLARAVGRREADFREWYHRYVSGDPSVSVVGTPLPRAARPTEIPHVPLGRIAKAAAAATRSRPEAIRSSGPTRRLFVGLAREHDWRHTDLLARACACDPRTIHRIADIDLTPARLCLGDSRLRHGIPSWSQSRLDPVAKRGNSRA